VLEAEIRARRDQGIVCRDRAFSRHHEAPCPGKGTAQQRDGGVADLDLPDGAGRRCIGSESLGPRRLEKGGGIGPVEGEESQARPGIGEGGAGGRRLGVREPASRVGHLRGLVEDKPARIPRARDHGQGFDAAILVGERHARGLANGDPGPLAGHGGQPVASVGAVEGEDGGGRIVEEGDRVPRRAVFGREGGVPAVGGAVPYRALVTDDAGEDGARRLGALVEGGTAQAASLLEVVGRAVNVEMKARHLAHPGAEEGHVVLRRGKATDVDCRDVDGRLALDHPFGQHAARGGEADAARVHTGEDVKAAQLRRLAHHHHAVGGKALGSVEEGADLDRLQDGEALDGARQVGPELVPVLVQEAEGEVVGQGLDGQRLGVAVEAADEQAADLLAPVDEGVGVAEDRRLGRHPVDGHGQHVEMLRRVERDVDPGHQPDAPAPQPRAQHDRIARDGTLRRQNARDPAILLAETGDWGVLEESRAPVSRPAHIGGGDVRGVDPAVARAPNRAD
jgi:hypothetical protein